MDSQADSFHSHSIEHYRLLLNGSYAKLTIQKRQGQNQYYEEFLAEGTSPLEMMRIPAGTFLMGSPDDEIDRSSGEGPQHEVAISQFFTAHYPITQSQWRVVAAMPKVNRELKPDPSSSKGANACRAGVLV